MAFDAGMLACVIAQIKEKSLGARVEKVFQPERDEIVLQMRSIEGGKRLVINAGSSTPRIGFTAEQKENPASPPMLCMLLRKHLQGAKLANVYQEGFERVAVLEFETRDEMGFACRRYLIAEIMGKYSNLIFANEEKKIVSALHTVDFSTSSLRQVLPGMIYELPPKQEKLDPTKVTEAELDALLAEGSLDLAADKWITRTFLGMAASIAREIVFRATGRTDSALGECDRARLKKAFFGVVDCIKTSKFTPTMALSDGKPV